ncbi:MAG: serine hydrolase domain-containing protein [Pseudomonadota bacterium]
MSASDRRPRPFWRDRALAATAASLTLASGAVAQPRDADEALYLKRFHESGGSAREAYDTLEAVPGARRSKALPKSRAPLISPAVRARAKAYAEANNSTALLIWRGDGMELSAYFGETDATTPLVSRSMAKPLSTIAVGRAIALGKIKSLDQPVADFITEWRGTPKDKVLVRHLLDMRAGFLAQNASPDPGNIWSRAYLHPRHDQIIVNEYPLTHEPGEAYNYANATADLVAVLVERATGMRYGDFLSKEVLRPLGATGGDVWVDRPGGLAHSGCCILLPAETWLRLALLLMDDGVWEKDRLLPTGFVAEMRQGTAANPYYGLGVWAPGPYTERRGFGPPDRKAGGVLHSEPYATDDIFLFDGNSNQVVYIVPSQRLVILRMGGPPPKSPEWDNTVLPNMVLRDLAARGR